MMGAASQRRSFDQTIMGLQQAPASTYRIQRSVCRFRVSKRPSGEALSLKEYVRTERAVEESVLIRTGANPQRTPLSVLGFSHIFDTHSSSFILWW